MPEGPEIRRAVDKLARVLAGKRAVLVRFAPDKFPALQPVGRRLSGCMIGAIEARGKAILTHFDCGATIYSHNQLYGKWAIYRGAPPASPLQTRLTIASVSHTAVLYSASEIAVLDTGTIEHHPYIAKLGIQLLDPRVTVQQVLVHIEQHRFARRNLAVLLLDQSFLSGVGNYLRSEILFTARLHPGACIAGLATQQRQALANSALQLTRRSYRTGGVTNDPAIAARLKNEGVAFGRYRHWVFDREGEPCHQCGHRIRRIDAASRNLYLCEHCQPQDVDSSKQALPSKH